MLQPLVDVTQYVLTNCLCTSTNPISCRQLHACNVILYFKEVSYTVTYLFEQMKSFQF